MASRIRSITNYRIKNHAMRCSAGSCPRNPPTRQLLASLIPFILSLSLGLKSRAKTDPMPRPTRRNVIAESKSYVSLMCRPFCRAPIKTLRSNEHLSRSTNRATFSKLFVFRRMPHPATPRARTFDRSPDKSHRRRACSKHLSCAEQETHIVQIAHSLPLPLVIPTGAGALATAEWKAWSERSRRQTAF
jgi:hypothetical protein